MAKNALVAGPHWGSFQRSPDLLAGGERTGCYPRTPRTPTPSLETFVIDYRLFAWASVGRTQLQRLATPVRTSLLSDNLANTQCILNGKTDCKSRDDVNRRTFCRRGDMRTAGYRSAGSDVP